MTRFLPIVTILLSCSIIGAAAGASSPNFDGAWLRQDGTVRIDIAPCAGKLCAKNVWVKDAGGDEAVGDTLVMTLAPNASGGLSGQAFDQKRNQSYAIEIAQKDAGMMTRGCIVGGIICKTTSWSRAQ